jgi:hypothetical protein
MNGYLSPLYAESLAEFGAPLHLPQSDGWLLARPIPETVEQDAVGCYPLFKCGNWSALASDLELLATRIIAVSLVVDPFASVDARALQGCFPDVCRPFKEHAVVEFDGDWRRGVCRHHRRNIRLAARRIEVEACKDPANWLDTWSELYAHLVSRHGVRGMARFSLSSFRRQLNVPGIAAWHAAVANETVGMLLWYIAGEFAYYHLGAFSPLGYESGAAFALFDVALSELAARGVRCATLGAAAGWQSAASDGLSRFKNGWTDGRRTAWFCGRILAPAKYEQAIAARKVGPTGYFPKYRLPEAA